MTQGYLNSALNIGAPAVIKVGAGKVVSLVVPAGGSVTLNDTTSTGGAAAGNQIGVFGPGAYFFAFPFFNGLVASAVTTGFSVAFE